jgi:flagellar motor switch protein FliN/FliY
MTDNATRNPALDAVPIELRVCVGTARPRLGEMLSMGPETVLPLDRQIDDPVALYVGDRLIGEGELIEAGPSGSGQLGVRLTRLAGQGDDPA